MKVTALPTISPEAAVALAAWNKHHTHFCEVMSSQQTEVEVVCCHAWAFAHTSLKAAP